MIKNVSSKYDDKVKVHFYTKDSFTNVFMYLNKTYRKLFTFSYQIILLFINFITLHSDSSHSVCSSGQWS